MSVKKQFSSFEDMLQESSTPVLVDFYAPWCGPCQMMGPILDEVNRRLDGQVKVVKINTDKYPELASRYQIGALPTLALFQGGEVRERLEGVVPAEQLVARIQQVLA
ncbi:thioredoxin [Leptolyngbya sp. FACHB-261]|uniref:thioredoxin n=1 Tax=Leptolyngbya sp. FACHB-261 TaxID=2692806 RepID=UPI001682906D|nr:thioredoxin [Leptolyngbya sp. FACHB-261]MBD2102022.1 thioredoxin [Leptolyngbya sp. FACHB-261]